jgi:arsenate reductase-like glutaredoxin family protein
VNQTIIGRHLLPADGSRWPPAGRYAWPVPSITAQVFGTPDSQPTRAALRFFKERRIDVHFVDLRRKPMAAGELRRFVERLGARALADTASSAWRDAGLGYLSMSDAELTERLLADQRLLRLPLVRAGSGVVAGRDEAAWSRLLESR